ncbi:MAG: hydrolase [Chthoniobacteraceae bacterium]|nr:hydrolase [Chthoniobacteraceae bacterium]
MNFHDHIHDSAGWKTVGDETSFANPYIEVHTVTVTSPMRPEPFTWTVAHRKGAVVIAPITSEGKFLLVRQERVPIRATIWEFPAGQIDQSTGHDEAAIRATGLRELREESGYELAPDGELISLGLFFPSCGFTDEHSHLVLARPVILSANGPEHDEHEAITEARAFTLAELRSMIASGEIRDANTLSAFARLVAMDLI